MNCLEFRRTAMIDPDSADAGFRLHAQDCRACAKFLQRQHELEARLRRALAIEPPSALTARVLLKQSFAKRHWLPRLAVAASIVLAIAVTGMMYVWNRPSSLAAEVLAHIHAEPQAAAANGVESPAKLAAVLRVLDTQIESAPAEIRYANICDIRRQLGAHLVLAGERGPVTVLIMPKEKVLHRIAVSDAELEGAVLPLGRGSIAIVGQRGEPLEAIERGLRIKFASANDV